MAAIARPLVANDKTKNGTRPCRFIRGQGRALLSPSGRLQVLGRGLTGLAVGHHFEGDLLAFLEVVEPGALDRADVDEDVRGAILRLDESVALLGVEPLHSAFSHFWSFIYMSFKSHARAWLRLVLEILGRSSVRRVNRG